MKKIFLSFLFVGILIAISGCGVKTEPSSAGESFPRNYPVY